MACSVKWFPDLIVVQFPAALKIDFVVSNRSAAAPAKLSMI